MKIKSVTKRVTEGILLIILNTFTLIQKNHRRSLLGNFTSVQLFENQNRQYINQINSDLKNIKFLYNKLHAKCKQWANKSGQDDNSNEDSRENLQNHVHECGDKWKITHILVSISHI